MILPVRGVTTATSDVTVMWSILALKGINRSGDIFGNAFCLSYFTLNQL